jgi:DNA-binding response OmpR family regulator
VIVLDLNLGDDNGATLMQLLSIAHPHVPILIYTGRELDDAAVADLCEEGAYDCLRKGTMEELLEAVGAAVEAGPGQPHVDSPESDEPHHGVPGSGIESVLIVEDDVEFGDMLRSFLESHPFCVTRVTDGAEALRHIESVDFDLIFCDIVLPHLSGEQLYQAVERTKPHLCQRFIFMTGHEADPKSDAFIRRVRGLMLWKPFHLADLLTAAQIIRRRTLLKRVVAATAMSS